MKLEDNFKARVLEALMAARENYGASDSAFARQWGINPAVYSQLKKVKNTDGLIADDKLVQIGRRLGVSPKSRSWNIVRTEVFEHIAEEVKFCKENSKAIILVDDCGIGKTAAAKYLAQTEKNCFRVDCSQCPTKQDFVRTIAQTVGANSDGRYKDVIADLKYYLQILDNPIIILDEAGYLAYPAFLVIQELWNATEGFVGWYMMGADGLREKIEKGIKHRKAGYREIFNRFSNMYSSVVPEDINERRQFYKKLHTDVLTGNVANKEIIPQLVAQCFKEDRKYNGLPGLRRIESVLILNRVA